jgi:hypothetical protein
MTLPLNPGIARTVVWLNGLGFETTDSGDGKTHDFECDRPHAYVVISSTPETLLEDTERLRVALLERGVEVGDLREDGTGPFVQASYVPGSAFPAHIDLQNVDDELLRLA